MKWPKISFRKTFRQIEKEHQITVERNDVRPWNLGNHPSDSFYRKPEPDFEKMRKKFDRASSRYPEQ